MDLNKHQKILLFLIIFFSIIFVYELSEASAQEEMPEAEENINSNFSEQNELLEKETETNQTNSEEKIDYGQPLPLPEEYYEQEQNISEEESRAEAIVNSSNESSENSSEETNETLPGENQTNEPSENETQINETEPAEPEHDLGISKLEAEPDEENELKVKIKIQVKNYGKNKENNLHLLRTIGNKTKEYGPYDDEITYSSTRNYQKTFSEPGEYNITFEILNYTSFIKDENKTNNIKSITVNL
ncbi:MAG: hypothetical protein R6U26_01050 [Candidatus Undinarchaeales archaeon]